MDMKRFSEERLRRPGAKSGWNAARAQGYSDGRLARSRDAQPSEYGLVGTDDYCIGYRDGYFGRPKQAVITFPNVELPEKRDLMRSIVA
jgi:hypothetical protein